MNQSLFSRKKSFAFASILSAAMIVIFFQNCSDKFAFKANPDNNVIKTSSGSSAVSLGGDSGNMIESSSVVEQSVSGNTAEHQIGQRYGSCTMQVDGSFQIVHNGAIDSNGNKLANVPDGVGGATWPVTVCPNRGDFTKTYVLCADGFKPVVQEFTQMDCRSNSAAAKCSTYWATYNCIKVNSNDAIVKVPASSSGSSSGGTSGGSATYSLKWVYTHVTSCVGPTPPPANIGAACSVAGQTASNACGTATCSYVSN